MNLPQFLDFLKQDPELGPNLSGSYTFPAQSARFAPIPEALNDRLKVALQMNGHNRLYTHQHDAVTAALRGENTVVVTPTASGKTLTYTLPIFHRKLENPHSRSLLLFPTKALAQDQLAGLEAYNQACESEFKIYTYDGDTAPNIRRRISEAGDFVVTNPDMLHAGILPHHTQWIKLFENLEFVVLDELHSYRGVFGSHVANLLRRLLRICDFYGSSPRFLTSSATIANPREHAERLAGRPFTLVDNNGAPRGAKHVIIYNPPVVNQALGVRASSLKQTAKLGAYLLKNKIRTIFFCQSRIRVELLFTYLCDRVPELRDRIRSYRGGYLPNERRKIEKELREGHCMAVVSTNALELGVDIGQLEVSVTMGYPGSISSLTQQFGRAGRRNNESLSILVATSSGTDQYLAAHPKYFFEKSPEMAMTNPDNLLVAADHIKCSAFELPFRRGESLGDFPATAEVLEHLTVNRVLNESDDRFHWMDDVYPANTFSLRTGPRKNFVIVDVTNQAKEEVIGEIDYFAAPTLIHKDAIYIHQGVQFYVEDLLWDDLQARVRRINVDYYTDAQDKVELEILEDEGGREHNGFELHRGELALKIKAVMFKKIKLETHENLGFGDIHTPEIEMHSQAGWILLPDSHPFRRRLDREELGATLAGAAYALSIVAPLFVLCDPRDMRFRSEVRETLFKEPAIYFYDSYPGGLELCFRILENLAVIAGSAHENVTDCPCDAGCPSCVGLPDGEIDLKRLTAELLGELAR